MLNKTIKGEIKVTRLFVINIITAVKFYRTSGNTHLIKLNLENNQNILIILNKSCCAFGKLSRPEQFPLCFDFPAQEDNGVVVGVMARQEERLNVWWWG